MHLLQNTHAALINSIKISDKYTFSFGYIHMKPKINPVAASYKATCSFWQNNVKLLMNQMRLLANKLGDFYPSSYRFQNIDLDLAIKSLSRYVADRQTDGKNTCEFIKYIFKKRLGWVNRRKYQNFHARNTFISILCRIIFADRIHIPGAFQAHSKLQTYEPYKRIFYENSYHAKSFKYVLVGCSLITKIKTKNTIQGNIE